jgi:hypothetical protein
MKKKYVILLANDYSNDDYSQVILSNPPDDMIVELDEDDVQAIIRYQHYHSTIRYVALEIAEPKEVKNTFQKILEESRKRLEKEREEERLSKERAEQRKAKAQKSKEEKEAAEFERLKKKFGP